MFVPFFSLGYTSRVFRNRPIRLRFQLVALALARTFINIGLRMVYPFAPALARGTGVELTSIYRLITIRNFASFLSPLFGPVTESVGRKRIMVASLLLFSAGCLFVSIWPEFWPLGVALVLIALAKVIHDPAMQAFVGDTVPYGQRGKAFAVTELSWAGALLIGAPAVGVIIERQGWHAPFFWLAISGIAAALLISKVLPRHAPVRSGITSYRETWRVFGRYPVIRAAAAYSLLVMVANETFFIVYGDWMEGSFDLQLASLGLASGIIGAAEIVGELFAGWSVDRFGKRPVIITTGLLSALLYLVVPLAGESLFGALATLFFLFLFFEITVVGAVPLLSEIIPGARGVVMATVLAFGALGRTLGDVFGPAIWAWGKLAGNGFAASVIMILAMVLLARWIREGS